MDVSNFITVRPGKVFQTVGSPFMEWEEETDSCVVSDVTLLSAHRRNECTESPVSLSRPVT